MTRKHCGNISASVAIHPWKHTPQGACKMHHMKPCRYIPGSIMDTSGSLVDTPPEAWWLKLRKLCGYTIGSLVEYPNPWKYGYTIGSIGDTLLHPTQAFQFYTWKSCGYMNRSPWKHLQKHWRNTIRCLVDMPGLVGTKSKALLTCHGYTIGSLRIPVHLWKHTVHVVDISLVYTPQEVFLTSTP